MSELSSRACQDCGGQSFDLHGRQNEEAPVVDDVLQIARLLFGVTSNPPVARRDLPGGSGPQEGGQNLAIAGFDEGPEVRAGRNTASDKTETTDGGTRRPACRAVDQSKG